MPDRKMMRDIGLNDPVTIILPAHIWIAAMSAYAEAEWGNAPMSVVFRKVQETILDPLYMREQEAAHQQQQDYQQDFFQHTTTGQLPEVPPNAEDLG